MIQTGPAHLGSPGSPSALRLDKPDRERLRWAALLHDIGNLQVGAHVLNTPGHLDRDEWEVIRRRWGADLARARIVAVADAFEVMTGNRIYRLHPAWGDPEGSGDADADSVAGLRSPEE